MDWLPDNSLLTWTLLWLLYCVTTSRLYQGLEPWAQVALVPMLIGGALPLLGVAVAIMVP